MQDGIVIKSSKAGMTVILNPDMPFAELLASVAKKFGDSARFWGSAQMTLTLEGRSLTPEEEFQIVIISRLLGIIFSFVIRVVRSITYILFNIF